MLSNHLLSCILGDYQEVPDSLPSARGQNSEWNSEQGAEHHLVPREHYCRWLQRGRLHTKIFRLQLSGKDPQAKKLFFFFTQTKLLATSQASFWICGSIFQTVYAVPILTFAFVCHPAILPMYEELKEWVCAAFNLLISHFPNNRKLVVSKWNTLPPVQTAVLAEGCRVLLTCPSWPCSSCTCWQPFSDTWPLTVSLAADVHYLVVCLKIHSQIAFSATGLPAVIVPE